MTDNLTPIGDLVSLRYVPLGHVLYWGKNPKKHDLPGIMASIEQYGFQIAPKFDGSLNEGQGGLATGNGSIEALNHLKEKGEPPPTGIALTEDGEWHVPIIFGNDLPSQTIAQSFALDDNNLVLAGGGFSAIYMTQIWDEGPYVNLLVELNQQGALPVTVREPDMELLMGMLFGTKDTKKQTKDSRITIGQYSIKIPQSLYIPWANELSELFEFDKPAVIAELQSRLGLTAAEQRLEAVPHD